MAPEVSRKRKNSIDQDGRVIKHRASKACQACRARKVRCDVLVNASRCTNCRLDQLECVVLASRRGHNKRRRNLHAISPRPADPAEVVPDTNVAGSSIDATWTGANKQTDPVPVCVTFEDDAGHDKSDDDDNDADQRPCAIHDAAANPSPSTPHAGLLTPDTRPDNGLQRHQDSAERHSLPAFITPLSSRLPGEDLDFLVRKGALDIPSPDLRIEILRAYLFSVHPFMPMLDYRAFAHAVLNNNSDQHISLLLFQAVMFAGLHSLEPAIIHSLGFRSAKQARAVFFNRVRLLYEFDIEPDMASVLQSLILMSSWYSKWDARRDTWHWTGLAYDVARRMGLHRETTEVVSEKARHFRKRLWWSLYIRDRMIALGTRRPLRIYDSDYDVGMLALDDFDLEPFHETYQGDPLIPCVKENEATALMCISLAKLCICVGRVVASQYTTLRSQHDQDIPHAVMVVSRRDEGRAEELESCNQQLTEWYQDLTETGPPTISTASRATTCHDCAEVHWAVLNMTYQTTVNVLHRTQALRPISKAPVAVQNSSKSKVKRSARDLTKLSQSMLRRDHLRFVGLIGVTAIIAAYLSHILDITGADNNDDDDVRDASTFRLYQSLEVLQAFRGIYASADAAVSFLASVSRKAGIAMPMQATGSNISLPSATRTPMLPTHDRKQASRRGYSLQDARSTNWPIEPYAVATSPVNKHPRGLGADERISNITQMTTRPDEHSTSCTAASDFTQTSQYSMGMAPATQYSHSYSGDAALAGFLGSADDGTSYFDWNDSIEDRGNSFDLSLMSFDHDFYIDTFGFTDTRLQGL